MKIVLVLGAGGQIARWVIEMLASNSKIEITLFFTLQKSNAVRRRMRTSFIAEAKELTV
jgi:saccharopine dehydrogenase-like NADP-dependent oxidoreductase